MSQAIQKSLQSRPDITHIVAASTKFGANVTPRVAATIGVSPITDIIAVEAEEKDTFVRPTYAGNALVKVKAKGEGVRVLSVRSTAFEKAECVQVVYIKCRKSDVVADLLISYFRCI